MHTLTGLSEDLSGFGDSIGDGRDEAVAEEEEEEAAIETGADERKGKAEPEKPLSEGTIEKAADGSGIPGREVVAAGLKTSACS